MVQKSRGTSLGLKILSRIGFSVATPLLAFYTSDISLEILKNYLAYTTPLVDWGDLLVDASIAVSLGMVFWGALLFGAIGKKVDYLFIFLFTLFGFLNFYITETVTIQMYLGLIAAIIIGNAIGFALKLLRQRFLPKWDL